jgi:hypothetical protein
MLIQRLKNNSQKKIWIDDTPKFSTIKLVKNQTFKLEMDSIWTNHNHRNMIIL